MFYKIGIISNAIRNHEALQFDMHDLNVSSLSGAIVNCVCLLGTLLLYCLIFASSDGIDQISDILTSFHFFAFCSALSMSMYFGNQNNYRNPNNLND